MKKLLVLIGLCCMFTGCDATPLRKTENANANVTVSVLTEFDGIRLYSVDLGNHKVYVAVRASELHAIWDERCGRGCVQQMDVPTLATMR